MDVGASMISLEWTSPAGPAALALLAGPWRRLDATNDEPAEVFRMRVAGEEPVRSADPRQALASASHRFLAALQPNERGALPRAEAELRRTLAGDEIGMFSDVRPLLDDLTRRSLALARVESELGGQPHIVTEISATGTLQTRALAGAPAGLLTRHGEAVAAALHTRVTLLRTVVTTTELAAMLAAFASPAAASIALPLAWRFVHTLLTEHLASSPGE